MIQDLIDGIRSEVPDLRKVTMNAVSNIVFGSNSVQVNVAGGIPDQNQARTAGNAMGAAAANMIASRNTRLAVRTL
jgi:L-lactate permease